MQQAHPKRWNLSTELRTWCGTAEYGNLYMLLVRAVLQGGSQSGASVIKQHEHLGAFHLKSLLKELQSFITEMREPTNHCSVLLSITNKLQHYTIFFIIANALHVSGGFSAHHQELKNCTHSIWYVPGLLAATASVVELELNHAGGSSKQAWHIPDAVCTDSSWAPGDGRRNRPKHVEHWQ